MFILSSFWDKVGSAVVEALRSLMLSLAEIIYKLIVFFFDIFSMLGNARVLQDSTVQEIYERIGLILGLFMIFRVIFSLIQYIMNPDNMFDKQKGLFNIVKKIVIVVVLLGVTPSLFNLAYDAQRMIINSNIIPKVITGKTNQSDEFGYDLAWYTFNSFFRFNDDVSDADKNTYCPALINNGLYTDFKLGHGFRYAYNCVNTVVESSDSDEGFYYVIDFAGHGIMSVLVGTIILWMIIMYTIQVGVRVVQLAYLQLIAPVPIIMYVTPKGEDTFNKWVKQCTNTYLDFFLRVAIIYLVVFIIQLLIGEDSEFFLDSIGNPSGIDLFWIKIVMIIALLVFAQKVPKLFKELFPGFGGAAGFDFGLKPSKEMKNVLGFGAGALAGGAVGLIGGGLKGFAGGITKGAISGAKGKKISEITAARAAQNVKNRQIRDSESTFGGRVDARLRNTFGLESRTAALDRQMHDIDIDNIRPIDDKIKEINDNPIMEVKRRNDTIISARKAMIDEAEKELLKAGSGSTYLRDLKERIEWARNDFANGGMTTSADILTMEDGYKAALDREAAAWIDANSSTNGVIITNMRTISNETGTIVNTAAGAKSASDAARSENNTNAAIIADLEFKKQELQRTKKEHEDRKSDLNRQKEKPQADENAIKK